MNSKKLNKSKDQNIEQNISQEILNKKLIARKEDLFTLLKKFDNDEHIMFQREKKKK